MFCKISLFFLLSHGTIFVFRGETKTMNKKTKLLSTILGALAFTQLMATPLNEQKLLGVYKLTKFATVAANGEETPWCIGAKGSIAYVPGFVSVSINCESTVPGSNAAELDGTLFYSGPFELDVKTQEVVHRVRNYSHPSLHKVLRRKVSLKDDRQLLLSAELGEGKKIIIEWERIEKLKYDNSPLIGLYELVGSENEVEGSDEKIPFCSGFYGSIFYTPGGFGAVSINCGAKTDPSKVEPADMFGRKFFYSGPYTKTDTLLVQNMLNASHAGSLGGEAVREMEIKNDLLILKGTNGSKFVATWRKLKGFVSLKD